MNAHTPNIRALVIQAHQTSTGLLTAAGVYRKTERYWLDTEAAAKRHIEDMHRQLKREQVLFCVFDETAGLSRYGLLSRFDELNEMDAIETVSIVNNIGYLAGLI